MDIKPVEDWLRSRNFNITTYCDGKWSEDDASVSTFELDIDGNALQISLSKSDESSVFLQIPDAWKDPWNRSVCFQKLYELYSSSEQLSVATILETISTSTPISVARKRLQDRFLGFLTHYKDLGAFLNSVSEPKNYEVFMNAGTSLMSTIATSVIPVIARGESIGLHVESTNIGTILLVAHFIDLCHKAGFPNGIIYFDFCEFDAENRGRTSSVFALPVAVVSDNADIHSASERILELIIHRKRSVNTLLVFLQQSISSLFEKRFKFVCEKILIPGNNVFDRNINILEGYEMRFDAVDIIAAIEDENVSSKIHVHFFKYRTNEELIKLLNYIPEIRFMTIWTEDIPLGLDIANQVKKYPLAWINSVFDYHPSVLIDDRFYEFYLLKPLKVNEYNGKIVDTFERSLKAQEKWALQSNEQRLKTIYKCLKGVFESLKVMYDKLRVAKELSKSIAITNRKPIGIVVFEPTDPCSNEMIEFIALCLLAGNSLILLTESLVQETESIHEFLKNFPPNLVQFITKSELDFVSEYNAYVILNEIEVGILFRNAYANEAIDLNELIDTVTRPKTIWFQSAGVINYAL